MEGTLSETYVSGRHVKNLSSSQGDVSAGGKTPPPRYVSADAVTRVSHDVRLVNEVRQVRGS